VKRVVRTSVIGILILGSVGTYTARAWREAHTLRPEQVEAIRARLEAFPLETTQPHFVGRRDFLDPRIVAKSGADEYLAVDYTDDEGGIVRLHIGASARTDAWFHAPAVCLPAHGWTTGTTSSVPIWPGLAGARPEDRILRLTLHREGARLLVYYWYQYGETILTSKTERRRVRFLDLLGGRQDRPARIVIFYAPIDDDEEAGEKRIAGLVEALWSDLVALDGDA